MLLLPPLTRCLESLRRRAQRRMARRGDGRTEAAGHCADIESCRVSLLGFGRQSDEEFTALARGLGKLTGRLNELRAQAEDLDRIIGDRDEERAMESADALYKSSVDLVQAGADTATSAEEQLGRIETILTTACRTRDEFRRNHLLLHVLSVNMRMEAARLSAEDRSVFLHVAAHTAEIGAKILAGTETAFGRIDGVITDTIAERADLQDLDHVISRDATQSILTIQRDLDALKRALAPCAEKSREIGALFAGAGPQTMRVIGSLQHQDIVRQQLEHVAEGFQDMAGHLRVPGQIEWTYVRQAGAIQQAQLEAARVDITQAGAAVLAGLQGVLKSHADMVGLFEAMEQTAAAALGNCHVAQSFAGEIRDLSRVVERSGAANRRIAQLVDHICEVVEVFTEEIARHEFDLKIVALNAQIAAAHLPAADALNKLAEETCAASSANARATRELVTSLSTGLEQLHKVKGETDEFLTVVNREKAELETGAGVVSRKLGQLLIRVQTGAVRVRREFEPLYQESQALVASVDFPTLIDASFAPAATLCVRLKEAAAARADGEELSADALRQLEQHQQRYTMHKENATHAAALSAAATASSVAGPLAAPGDVELSGESSPAGPATPGDIELFGTEPTPGEDGAVRVAVAAGDIELFGLAAVPPAPVKAESGRTSDTPTADRTVTVASAVTASQAKSPAANPPSVASTAFGDGIELF